MRQTRTLTMLAALLAAGCAVGTVAPVTTPLLRQTGILNLPSRNLESGVDTQRLKDTLAVLSGKTPMANGTTVPERGSVKGRELTRQYLTSVLQSYGYTVERYKYRTNGENVIARLPATTKTAETMLVGAHMDSVSNAGANDNGTGTVSVLEVARLMKQMPERQQNVIFAWFDEEELGLVGSEYMAEAWHKQGIKLTSVHTMDMMGWDSDKDRAVEIERPDGTLWDYYQMVNKNHGLNLKLQRTNGGSTDHVAWHKEGYTCVGLCEEWTNGDTTPYYHRKTDTWDTIDFDFLASTTRLFTAAVHDLVAKVPAPANSRFIPHNQFPGRDHGCGNTTGHDHSKD